DECEKCDINAICVHGRCKCRAGYIGNGYECEKEECDGCNPNAHCLKGVCVCFDHYIGNGYNCQHHLNPCQDGGIYVSMAHGYFCICPKDYRGKDCQERNYCSSMPCLNGGSCVEIPGAFKCGCPFGFLGTVCEERDACHPNPCKNGGTCTRSDTESGFVCVCKEGFTGEHCEGFNRCDPNPCKNGATCQQIKDDKYECLCPPPYKGTLCAVHVCHPNPCHHGGRCEVESGHFKCVCPPLYKGYQCEIPHPCFTRPCQNNGVCIDSYSGFSAYPDNWDSHGYLHYLCLCQQGFMGPNCEMKIEKQIFAICLLDLHLL
ncbi:predicted protein, partial [Nematostella vectensis]